MSGSNRWLKPRFFAHDRSRSFDEGLASAHGGSCDEEPLIQFSGRFLVRTRYVQSVSMICFLVAKEMPNTRASFSPPACQMSPSIGSRLRAPVFAAENLTTGEVKLCPSFLCVTVATADGNEPFIKKLALEVDCNPELLLGVTLRGPRPDSVRLLLGSRLLRNAREPQRRCQ